jgi:hypothetical protein
VTPTAGGALVALALLSVMTDRLAAQDTVVARQGLALDVTRISPYRRAYDMIVQTRDSAVVIGERQVTLSTGTYAGNPAWLIVESRTGIVPAAETLYVAPDMRPLYWHATQGAASLGVAFVGDTILGAMSGPTGKRNVVVGGAVNLLVSHAMIEALLALLPLAPEFTDSATVLAVDVAMGSAVPVELSVISEETVVIDSVLSRPAWVVALRAEGRAILFWIDKESGDVHKSQQSLPNHVGSLLEYRRRADAAPAAP